MNLSPYELSDLIARHIQQKLSAEESLCLLEWLNESEKNQILFDRLVKAEQVKDSFDFFDALDTEAAWKKTERKRTFQRIKRVVPYLGYAAAIACIVFSILVFLPQQTTDPQQAMQVVSASDLLPGSEKAVLKLSNGEVLNLNDHYLKIKEYNDFHIICKEGELNYSGVKVIDKRMAYNTLTVPKSGTYRLVLADGTKVWLNSLSEIQFPVQFNRSNRTVKLKGEAYFEVAHDPSKPFLVEVDAQTIQVLGTHFNVNSYDAQVKTTLLEGRVKVFNSYDAKFLVPGEQAEVLGNEISVKKGDLKKVMAWRTNEFYFKKESMREILVELSRWYDFKINDVQLMDNKRFSGVINRDLKFSEVLKILHSLSGYQFQFDGIVLKINNQNSKNNLSIPN